MYTHVYICIHCMFWGVHVYTCIYLYSWYILGSIYIYICTYLYICFEICVCVCVCVYVCACMMFRKWLFWSDCGCRNSKYMYIYILSQSLVVTLWRATAKLKPLRRRAPMWWPLARLIVTQKAVWDPANSLLAVAGIGTGEGQAWEYSKHHFIWYKAKNTSV